MSRHLKQRPASALDSRLEALNAARELGEGRLPADALQTAYDVLERASSRRSLSSEHTVVGFFGATGSGKSSLFNAISGTEAAVVGARRPTTSEALAAVWNPSGSEPLLDWLGIPRRIHLDASALGGADNEGGLILLDLPDFDSTAAAHREVVERLVGMVDVLVWVLDPQKYADAAVHQDFLRNLAAHEAVTLVVLNQVDRLAPSDVLPVMDSLRAVLKEDGLGKVGILPVSAVTGAGIEDLRARITKFVVRKQASAARLSADVDRAASALAETAGSGSDGEVSNQARQRLFDALAVAAKVDLVADAVAGSYRLEAGKRTGWPVTRWLLRLRADPLRRLNLVRTRSSPDLRRTSLPPAGIREEALMDSAVRDFAEEAAGGVSEPWNAAVRTAAANGRAGLEEALDLSVARTDLNADRKAWWWPVMNVLQWLGLLTAVAGAGWLAVLAALGYLQFPVPEVPRVEGWPVPTVLLLAGVLLGIVLALASRPFAAIGARTRAAGARRRLRSAVAQTASDRVVGPVQAELTARRTFFENLRRARGR